jgi:hypothetical protein
MQLGKNLGIQNVVDIEIEEDSLSTTPISETVEVVASADVLTAATATV